MANEKNADQVKYEGATLDATGFGNSGNPAIEGVVKVHLISAEGDVNQKGTRYVALTVEIDEGEHQFSEAESRIYVTATQKRLPNGKLDKPYSRGIAEIIKMCAAVGSPWTKDEILTAPLDSKKLANIIQKKIGRKPLLARFYREEWDKKDPETGETIYDDEGKAVKSYGYKFQLVKAAAAAVPGAAVTTPSVVYNQTVGEVAAADKSAVPAESDLEDIFA